MTLLIALIVTAAAWLLWRRRGTIDTRHGRVKLENSTRVRLAWQQAHDIMAGDLDWRDLTAEEQDDIDRYVPGRIRR